MDKNKKPTKTTTYKKKGAMPLTGPILHRAEITPLAAVSDFLPEFLDEARCREWIYRRLHPTGVFCPACELFVENPTQDRAFWAGRQVHCACGRWFTALTNTPFCGSKLDTRQLFLLTVLIGMMDSRLTPAFIASCVDVSPDTVRFYIKKFKVIGGE